MINPDIRKPYDRVRVIKDLSGQVKKTDASQGNDTNINNIVARFKRTGELPEGAPGEYCDVSALQGDLTELIQKGEDAKKELKRLQEQHTKEQKEASENNQKELERLQKLEKEFLARQRDLPLGDKEP